jgi:hypothetical protein
MVRKVLAFGLPIYLFLLELFLKTVAGLGSESLLGPTLAGAGIGFLLPLTDLKPIPLPEGLEDELADLDADVFLPRDKELTDWIWLAFLISLVAWMYSVFLSFPPAHPSFLSLPVVIGCAVFVLSIIFTEIKERI